MSEIERYDPFDGKLGFALANRVGDNVYVSGMTGIEFSDQRVPDGIEAQARLAYKNIESILSQFGASLADSIEQTIFFVGDHAAANGCVRVGAPRIFRGYAARVDNGRRHSARGSALPN